MMCRLALLASSSLWLGATLVAQPLPDPVYPIRDDVGMLSAGMAERIGDRIAALEAATSAEIGVLITATTHGADPHDYALRVFNHWGVGKADRDNGVLLMFAMSDRRVELVPGVAYERLFDRRRSELLLKSVVVPRMRSGRQEEAVLAIVEEVAREIRIHEGVETPAPEGTAEAPAEGPAPVGPERSTRAQTLSPDELARIEAQQRRTTRQRLWVMLLAAAGVLAWGAISLALLVTALARGRLLLPRPVLWAFLLGGGAVLAAGVGFLAFSSNTEELLPFAGLGGAATLVLGLVGRHSCPQCNRWMSIDRDTITAPTYSSSGRGVRTVDCRHCGFHESKTYTIPRRQRSSSSSSSFGSSGGSFGGGSSRGGGGGASW